MFFFFYLLAKMANVIFTEQENVCLRPSSLKMRQRLLSAPGI